MAKDSSSFDLHYVEDFYFFALFDDDNENSDHDMDFEVLDEKYAQELQLQEALMASSMAVPVIANDVPSSSGSSSSFTPSVPVTVSVTPTPETPPEESDEPEREPESLSFCEICVERKEADRMYKNERCLHSFCSDCISKYVATKINETLTVEISCPSLDCKKFIELETCREILPKEVVERWDDALCEALIMAAEKVYCPFKDCSAVMIVEEEGGAITESECPICHRLFCAQCQAEWHPGIECEEYQILNEDERGREDLLMRELALEEKWRRCPQCNYFVDKTDGCLHITCRPCSFELKPKLESELETESESLNFCEICVEEKETDQMFKNEGCLHSFCSDCISKYVETKINEALTAVISCPNPDCKSFIELETSRKILPTKVAEQWDKALCKALILAEEKVYCPFRDCSAELIREERGVAITESECPICHRLFCAACKVPWHPGMKCKDYQKLNGDERGREDMMMMNLVQKEKWRRCPQCNYFVEKTSGCLHITCRCKFHFCYACGSKWSIDHHCPSNSRFETELDILMIYLCLLFLVYLGIFFL